MSDLFGTLRRNAQHLPQVVVDSSSFLKLPMVRPGETSSEISSARIAALESMVNNLIDQNKVILETVADLKKKQDTPLTYASKVAATTVAGSGSGGGQVQQGGSGQQQHFRGRDNSHTQLTVPRFIRERSNSNKRQRVSSENEDNGQNPGSNSKEVGGAWNDQSRRNLRSNGVKVVRGTASVTGDQGGQARQGWRAAPRDIFVYHTHHSTCEEDIKDLVMETSKVEVIEVEKRSREGSYFGSFRLRVNRGQFDTAMQPEHWPAGWSVREYFVARQRPGPRPGAQQDQSGP